jgi:hypothetical protein
MEFHFIKAQYESKVTWKTDTDYIRCSPKYHNYPRYDCVLLNTSNGPVFAQLVLVFVVVVDGKDYSIALVPMNSCGWFLQGCARRMKTWVSYVSSNSRNIGWNLFGHSQLSEELLLCQHMMTKTTPLFLIF